MADMRDIFEFTAFKSRAHGIRAMVPALGAIAALALAPACTDDGSSTGPQGTPNPSDEPTPTDDPPDRPPTVNEDVKVLMVTPQEGPSLGGTEIEITGEGFTAFSAVLVGNSPALDVVLVDTQGTRMLAITPPGSAGCADVRVENGAGIGLLPCAFTFIETVSCQAVTPELLDPEGGEEIQIRGSGFGAETEVLIGGRPAEEVRVVNSTSIIARTPVGAPGRANIVVSNEFGTGRCEDAVLYKDFLTVLGMQPNRGPLEGGNEVWLVGNGFETEDGVLEVTFGEAPAEILEIPANDRALLRVPAGVQPGPVDIIVKNLYGERFVQRAYLYFEPVRLDSVSPGESPAEGGVDFVIRGAGLVDGTVVTVGGRAAIDVRVDRSGEIVRAKTPPNDVGPKDLRVINANGSAVLEDAIVYSEALAVDGVLPAGGPIAGGNTVALTGAGFSRDAEVRFGRNDATSVRYLNSRNLSVTVPAGRLGPTTVCVAQDGDEQCLAGGYVYFDEAMTSLQILGVAPASGPSNGGAAVEIVGAGFGEDATVQFGATDAAEVTVLSTNMLRAISPAASAGVVDVSVSSAGSTATLADGYTYFRSLGCESLSANTGPVEGGTAVTITGSGFTAGVRVRVGALDAETTFVDGTSLQIVTPPGAVGDADVIIDNGATTCEFTRGFTYLDDLQIMTVQPNNGAVAGGTLITVIGSGFTDDLVVRFGDTEGTDLEVIDPATLKVRTPPGAPGPTDVALDRGGEISRLPRGYVYFDPTLGLGGTGGGPVAGAVNVTVISADGAPIAEALVVLEDVDLQASYQDRTNEMGQVVVSEDDLVGVQRITAAAEGFASGSVNDFDAANITIVLFPLPVPNPGQPPAGPGPPRVTGTLNVDPKHFYDLLTPGQRERACARVATSAAGFGAQNPPAGDGAIVFFSDEARVGEELTFVESGTFEIISRPGDFSLYAIAGSCRLDNGTWIMVEPVAMGMRHFLFAVVDEVTEGADIYVTRRLKASIPVELDNPPMDPSGPNIFQVEPFLIFGDGTAFQPTRETRLPPGAIQPETDPFWSGFIEGGRDTEYVIVGFPELTNPDVATLGDASYCFIGTAATLQGGQATVPMSTTFLCDVAEAPTPASPALITPFVSAPVAVTPLDGERPIANRFQFDFVPATPPSFNTVFFFELSLFGPVIHWYVVLPGDVTEFVLPDVTTEGLAGLPQGGVLFWQIISAWAPGFDIDNFDYNTVLGATDASAVGVHFFEY